MKLVKFIGSTGSPGKFSVNPEKVVALAQADGKGSPGIPGPQFTRIFFDSRTYWTTPMGIDEVEKMLYG